MTCQAVCFPYVYQGALAHHKKLYLHDLIDCSILTDMATCDVAVDTD